MSQELIPTLSLKNLERIHFGDPDATRDSLIQDQMCICKIRPMADFLRDKSTILVGERGSGKTAIFELLKAGKLRFEEPAEYNQIIIPISESLDYRTLEAVVTTSIQSKSNSPELHHRAIWELLVLYYLIPKVKEMTDLPERISKHLELFDSQFYGKKQAPSFFELAFKGKKRVGVKFDVSPAGFTVPDVYAQYNPEVNSAPSETINPTPIILQLGIFKNELNNFLASRRIKIHILIDRIDEFVVRDEYATQMNALNGLLAVEKGYHSFPSISVKLFLRADLFRKLDLRESGADKVMARRVELVWSAEEIRDFLAKRILYNYLMLFSNGRYEFPINTERIYLDNRSNFDTVKTNWRHRSGVWLRQKILYGFALTLGSVFPAASKHYFARHSNFNDGINLHLLSGFFGEQVCHVTETGVEKFISIEEYLETHFKLNTGHSTPRVMLMFMDESVRSAVDYYGKNSLMQKLEFPVIPLRVVSDAYRSFRLKLWEALAQESKTASNLVRELARHFGSEKFSAKDVMRALAIKSERELDEFLAIINHLGILGCVNKNLALEKRVYHLPVLFRAIRNLS